MIKKYIRGHQTRGVEVIEALKKIGGFSNPYVDGSLPSVLYYIDINNNIDVVIEDSTLGQLIKENYEEIKIPNSLPTTWLEWVKQNQIIEDEYYISTSSNIKPYNRTGKYPRREVYDANLLATEEDAKAILALIKLKRLRDTYRNGWVPDWTDYSTSKYSLYFEGNDLTQSISYIIPSFLSFQTEELRDEFFENFKDLIEEAKEFI